MLIAEAPKGSPKPRPQTLVERASAALDRGVAQLGTRQAADGHWPGDYGGPLFLLPGLLIALYVTGTPLSEHRRRRITAYLWHTQTQVGGWGLHIASPATVFGTALNYVALRLLGVPRSEERLRRARAWLLAQGGAEGVPSWGKFWLALLGVYRWEGVQPVPPELWLLPRQFPLHPSRLWCHTRAVYLPMSYLYGRRFTGPQTPLVAELRDELFTRPWDALDWRALREKVASGDLYQPLTPTLRGLQRVLRLHERRPSALLRKRALTFVADQIRREDESTGYLTIGPVSKALHLVAVWLADPESAAFQRHLERIDDYLWDGADGMKMQGYNGSQLWDTAFAMQALLESGLATQAGPSREVLQRAHAFLDANQVRQDVPERERHFRDATAGAWPFSTAEQGWTVSDCTAEGLKVALRCAPWVDRPLDDDRLRLAVDRLLEQQNADGGWSEYERARGPAWLERLNPAEIFGDIMVGHSYVECTSACVQGLALYRRERPAERAAELARALARGAELIHRRQRADGSWYGGWGICFTYGTWFGVEGLLAAGVSAASPAITRACAFLLGKQRADGGWGESYRSCVEQRWVEEAQTQAVQTAWAVLALLAAAEHGAPESATYRAAAERGVALLLARQRADGGWPQEAIAGVFNRTCMIHYDNYRDVMPLWALGRYVRLAGATLNSGAGGEPCSRT
ncbi:MAG: terpene cyclase/mutase family protein [Proteobacteria bacterium]|nr:terpene cyclase/mutase family protein [Pseudomonadota bacterium]